MVRVLVLTRYDRLGASSRIRFLQFLTVLEQSGMEFDVVPLLDGDYLRARYQNDRIKLLTLLRSYLRRAWALCRRRRYDLIWLEKEAFPWLPMWFESVLLRGVPYIVDLDDAWYLRYEDHRWRLVRMLLGSKIDSMMRNAAAVIAGNANLADRARSAGARRIELIPTTIDLRRYPPQGPTADGKPRAPHRITVGWIGTPFTVVYLQAFAPAFRAVASDIERLDVIGADVPAVFSGLPAKSVAWSESTEVADIDGIDVGVMPLADRTWEQGKCAYKLLQIMAAGKPVIASPVGANREVVQDGVNGLLASTSEEWVAALRRLVADPALRQRMGAAGRQTVESDYSVQTVAPKLAALLLETARQPALRGS